MAKDRLLDCKDCGQNFVFTVKEQEFFQSKGFNDPVRCTNCRRLRKQQREGGR